MSIKTKLINKFYKPHYNYRCGVKLNKICYFYYNRKEFLFRS